MWYEAYQTSPASHCMVLPPGECNCIISVVAHSFCKFRHDYCNRLYSVMLLAYSKLGYEVTNRGTQAPKTIPAESLDVIISRYV